MWGVSEPCSTMYDTGYDTSTGISCRSFEIVCFMYHGYAYNTFNGMYDFEHKAVQ